MAPKSGDEHSFPLPSLALALVEAQPVARTGSAPVLEGRHRGNPIRRDALSHRLRRN